MNDLIVIRGGGDLATGVAQKFFRSGFHVLILETDTPSAIRRTVSLCEAIYDQVAFVEDMVGVHIRSLHEMRRCHQLKQIPVFIDPQAHCLKEIKADCMIDAILAKKNMGSTKNMAMHTIALGPGFIAGTDVHIVIETMRGHDLGRLIFEGRAMENTKTPGIIEGKGAERVIHAACAGKIKHIQSIGAKLQKNEAFASIENTSILAPFEGILRGMIRENFSVFKGMKIADLDPRLKIDCKTISDKARNLGGAALEAYLLLKNGGLPCKK